MNLQTPRGHSAQTQSVVGLYPNTGRRVSDSGLGTLGRQSRGVDCRFHPNAFAKAHVFTSHIHGSSRKLSDGTASHEIRALELALLALVRSSQSFGKQVRRSKRLRASEQINWVEEVGSIFAKEG
jgi:hypothetical protein